MKQPLETPAANFDPLAVPVKLRVTPAAARHLASLGIETVGDALNYAPRRYYHWGKLTALSQLNEGEEITVLAQVISARLVHNRSGKGVRFLVGITDGSSELTVTFFARNEYALTHHQRLLQPGETFLFAGKVSEYQGNLQLVQPSFEEIEADSEQSVERRRGRPIPIYRAKASVPSWKIAGLIDQIMATVNWEQVPDPLADPDGGLGQRHSLLSLSRAYQLLHQPEDDTDWQNARRTLAWVEALTLQTSLLQPRVLADLAGTHRSRPLVPGQGEELVERLIRGLPFQLTGGQLEAWQQISSDLEGTSPMQRLLQADVGAGKTVVALLAMLRAVENGQQAALLAPTEVLATQHLASIQRLLDLARVEVPLHLLTGSQPASARENTLMHLAGGEPSLVVGTHALIQDGVEIPNLSVLVVDEQHRFGVSQREHLRQGRDPRPHLLVMTATPIPRTIALTVFGDLDVTAMRELPAGRTPVQTHRVPQENPVWMARLWQRAREEIAAGGRVYVVVPRIADEAEPAAPGVPLPSVDAVAAQLRAEPALAGIEVGIAHGQAKPEENARALERFARGEAPILVATTVVEVGVDVPEATMMVIWGAQQFGLSQLHQLRGRVGRSDRPSVCMLVHPVALNELAEARLQALVEHSDGFALAEVDLRLRQEGDVLGVVQSGGRSSLRFLSVRRDGAIIAAARTEAERILAEDLQLEQHSGLAREVDRVRGDQVRWLASS